MHPRLPRSAPAVLIAGGLLALTLTGGAFAAGLVTGAQIKDGTVASVDVKDGTLRKRDLSATTVNSLRGQQGPAGPQGDPGEPGQDGTTGPSTVFRTSPTDATLPGSGTTPAFVTLGALSLPAGAYAVTATFQLSHQEGTAQPVICQITVGSETSDPYAAILEPAFQGNFNNLPVTLTRAGPLAADGTASVSCKDNAGVDGVQVDVRRIHLSAVRVGNLVTQ